MGMRCLPVVIHGGMFHHRQPSRPHQGLPFHFLLYIICLKKELKTSREGH